MNESDLLLYCMNIKLATGILSIKDNCRTLGVNAIRTQIHHHQRSYRIHSLDVWSTLISLQLIDFGFSECSLPVSLFLKLH